MDPGDVERQDRLVSVVPVWEGEGQNFEEADCAPCDPAADSANDTITGGRAVTFVGVNRRNRYDGLSRRDQQIGDATPKFAGRTVIVRRRILDVAESGVSGTEYKRENEERFHGRINEYAKCVPEATL